MIDYLNKLARICRLSSFKVHRKVYVFSFKCVYNRLELIQQIFLCSFFYYWMALICIVSAIQPQNTYTYIYFTLKSHFR